MLVGYARTSSQDQLAGLEAQIAELTSAGCERVFREQVSSTVAREQLNAVMDFVREGDTLVVTKIDRLARSVVHLWEVVAILERKQVNLRILHFGGDSIDTVGATGRLVLNLFGAFAEFERSIMLDRQKAGIARAKAAGRYKGRKPTAQAKKAAVLDLAREGRKVSEIAGKLEIGRASVYRILAQEQHAARQGDRLAGS